MNEKCIWKSELITLDDDEKKFQMEHEFLMAAK
jgi:hypothetical protein